MKFTVEREHLLKPLQQVSGPLGGRPTLPILGNLLLQVADGTLSLTGTDLEMEMVARVALVQPHEPGATTVPARKFFDICRGLPEGAEIAVQLEGERMLVRSGRSRFSLSTLPAADFPNLDDWQSEVEFTLPQATMKRLIEATQFSMAHQDVRYYLNGMLFETEGEELRTVATDGHRLAVCSMPIGQSLPSHSVIVPRKGVIELMRMLDGGDNPLRVQIGSNNIRAHVGDFIFTSKLVDGRFPDYRRVLPKNPDKHLEAGCDLLKQAFARAVSQQQSTRSISPNEDEAAKFTSVILATTEDTWGQQFEKMGKTYQQPKLVMYRGMTRTGCGAGQSIMGPFYCPADGTVYIDLSFYDDMKDKLGADGDFAQGYVIAHEVGHHVQKLLGIEPKVRQLQQNATQAEVNRLSVRMELQADCFAGVWGHSMQQQGVLETGDLEEALNAAQAIGDDRLQQQSQGRVVPDSFTHGTSQQRYSWFKRGFDSGDPAQCNTFGKSI